MLVDAARCTEASPARRVRSACSPDISVAGSATATNRTAAAIRRALTMVSPVPAEGRVVPARVPADPAGRLRRRRGDRGPRRRQRRPGPAQGAHPGPRARERPVPPDGGRHRGPGLGGPASPSGCRASSVPHFTLLNDMLDDRPGARGRRRLPDAHHPAGAARDAPLALLGGGGAGARGRPPPVVAHEPGPRRSWPRPDGLGRQRRRAVRFRRCSSRTTPT